MSGISKNSNCLASPAKTPIFQASDSVRDRQKSAAAGDQGRAPQPTSTETGRGFICTRHFTALISWANKCRWELGIELHSKGF